MIKYKLFDVKDEKGINEFLDEHMLVENGIRFVENNAIFLYNTTDIDNPERKKYNIMMKIGDLKDKLSLSIFELKLLQLNEKKKQGGKEKQLSLMNDIINKKREIEYFEDGIKVFTEMIKEIK